MSNRSAKTGRYVTAKYAKKHKATTVKETDKNKQMRELKKELARYKKFADNIQSALIMLRPVSGYFEVKKEMLTDFVRPIINPKKQQPAN